MQNFTFYAPTRIFFGKGQIQMLGAETRKHANRVLLVYGKGSIKRNGIFDAVAEQLRSAGVEFVELGGVDPNPRLSTVIEGARLCRAHGLGLVLAVGGGSAIDCAKGIAAAALYDGDPWDFWSYRAAVPCALPVGAVLTLSATGSEMNGTSVITNEATLQKHGLGSDHLFPQFSILDPTYSYTVPTDQTAAGAADILAHVYEFYFTTFTSAHLQDGICEAIMRTVVQYAPIAQAEPENYEARANLMWASSMALNGVIKGGKEFDGFNHLVEHALSAIYDVTHGVGLAILAPHWMEYTLDETTVNRLAQFARSVWGVTETEPYAAARAGIAALRRFYAQLGLPAQLSQVGIGADRFDVIIDKSVRRDSETLGAFKKLTRAEIKQILTNAA
jgi:alcohol dehydrogenase YqhD (iron-dependent ADH family)